MWVHKHPIARLYYNDWGFCGCGNPENIIEMVRNILAAFHKLETDGYQGDWIIQQEEINELIGKDTRGLFLRYWLTQQDLIEHGGSVYGSWITEYGKQVLAVLENEDDTWDEDIELIEVTEKPPVETFLASPPQA